MKKVYEPAKIEIAVLLTDDILTVSDTFDPEDGKSDSAGWT